MVFIIYQHQKKKTDGTCGWLLFGSIQLVMMGQNLYFLPRISTKELSSLSLLQFSDAKCLPSLLVQIAYGRFSPTTKGYRDLDLFIQQKDGKKIQDPEKQSALCLSLKVEMLHPLRVIIANRGPDTELLVANPVELSGKGRPLVFYDVTLALKALRICIFSVSIGSIKLKVIQKPTKIILE